VSAVLTLCGDAQLGRAFAAFAEELEKFKFLRFVYAAPPSIYKIFRPFPLTFSLLKPT
jgi:hypothetical protein